VDWLRTERNRLTSQACETYEASKRLRELQFFGGKQTLDILNVNVRDIFVLSELADGGGQPAAIKLEAAAVAAAAKPCEEVESKGEEVVMELRNCSLSLLQQQLEHLGTPQLLFIYARACLV